MDAAMEVAAFFLRNHKTHSRGCCASAYREIIRKKPLQENKKLLIL